MKTKSTAPMMVMLFLSGSAALAYELIWFRIFGRYFGSTAYAISTVTAAFMLGLAVGAVLGGKLGDRSRNPLRLFGMIEMGIAVYCAAMPFLLRGLQYLYMPIHGTLAEHLAARIALQFLLALLLLLVPCILMGATLPVLCSGLVRSRSGIYEALPQLYAANSGGAAFGVLATGYLLIASFGVQQTNLIAVATDLLVGVFSWFYAGSFSFSPKEITEEKASNETVSGERATVAWLVLGATFLSGAAGMALELALFRALGVLAGFSIYTVTMILFLFLVTLGIGSWFVSLFRQRKELHVLGWVQAASGAMGALFLLGYNYYPDLYGSIFNAFSRSAEYPTLPHALFLSIIIVPVVLPFGCHFALANEIFVDLTDRVGRVGEGVGSVFLSNTLGAVAGSLLTGFVLLPLMGAHGAVAAVGVAGLLGGGTLLAFSLRKRARLGLLGTASMAVVIMVAPPWNPQNVRRGGGAHARDLLYDMEELKKQSVQDEVILNREDENSSVLLYRGGDGHLSLWVNGKPDASDYEPDMDTQTRSAYTPLLLHPNPRKVLTIGLGSGITSGTVGLFDSVERIDSIELSDGVVEASKHFNNYGLHDNPRSNIIIDDGRSFLERGTILYDVIISEPSNPWVSGTNNLFTREFFSLAKENLAANGVYCQWMQHYNLTPDEIKLVLRTFMSVFDEVTLWRSVASNDLLLIGAKDAFPQLTVERLRQIREENPGLNNLFDDQDQMLRWMLAGYLLEGPEITAYAGDGPMNTDDTPLLEFSAPLSRYRTYSSQIMEGILSEKHFAVPRLLKSPLELDAGFNLDLGIVLLGKARFQEAEWYFSRLPHRIGGNTELLPVPPRLPVREDFDGQPRYYFAPRAGRYRPEAADFVKWSVSERLLSLISGVYPGEGTNGSGGLVVAVVPPLAESSVSFLFPVHDQKTYEAGFDYRTSGLNGGSIGVILRELDRFEPSASEHAKEFYDQHETGVRQVYRGKETPQWQRASFQFEPTPGVKAIDLRFLMQSRNGAWVIDNLTIREKE